MGRTDFLWTVNTCTAAIIKSGTWRAMEFLQSLVCFWTHLLEDKCKLQYQHQVFLSIFSGRTYVPITWLCKKRTAVSFRSMEAEVIFLDAGGDSSHNHSLTEQSHAIDYVPDNIVVSNTRFLGESKTPHLRQSLAASHRLTHWLLVSLHVVLESRHIHFGRTLAQAHSAFVDSASP